MRPDRVIVLSPLLNDDLSLLETVKEGLKEIEWVISATSERWKHACEDLEPQVFLVA